MEWHWTEFFTLLHHLPHSVDDLLHHEDKELVKAGIMGFTVKAPLDRQKHHLILPDKIIAPPTAPSGEISIEKDIDPSVSRSQQNIGLLIHDYLHKLPVYEPNSKEAALLLEHWRKILVEQPQRLAQAKTTYWHSEKAKEFWQERIRRTKPDHIIYMEDWEHSAGAPAPHPSTLGARQEKQWQDLVIRNRLHNLTEYLCRMG
jgi:hypothetical protein